MIKETLPFFILRKTISRLVIFPLFFTLFLLLFSMILKGEVLADCWVNAGDDVCRNIQSSCTHSNHCQTMGCYTLSGAPSGNQYWCTPPWECSNSTNGDCLGLKHECHQNDQPEVCGGGGCFLPGEKVSSTEGGKDISNLNKNDRIVSFDFQSREQINSWVENIFQTTREFYYLTNYEGGGSLEVTGEHPLMSIKGEGVGLGFWEKLDLRFKNLVNKLF